MLHHVVKEEFYALRTLTGSSNHAGSDHAVFFTRGLVKVPGIRKHTYLKNCDFLCL